MKAKLKRVSTLLVKYQTPLKVGFTIITLAFLIYVSKPEKMWGFLLKMHMPTLGLVIVLKFVTDIFKIAKWKLLANTFSKVSFFEAARSFYIGVALAVITPFAVGELGRGLFLENRKKTELAALVVLDKIFDLGTVLCFSLIGIGFVMRLMWANVIVIIGYVFLPLITLYFMQRQLPPRFVKIQIVNRLHVVLQGIPPQKVLRALALSVVYFSLFYAQAYGILRASGTYFPVEVIYYFPLITLSTILPLTIGGVGIREGAAILFLKPYGIPSAVAFNTFFIHFVIANVFAGLIGVAFLWYGKTKSQADASIVKA